jgi:hypothetical protein
VVNVKVSARHADVLSCDCIGQLQRLAVCTEAGVWTLADRAKLVTLADAVFDDALRA